MVRRVSRLHYFYPTSEIFNQYFFVKINNVVIL